MGGSAVEATPLDISVRDVQRFAERVGRTHDIYSDAGLADLDKLLDRLDGEVVVRDGIESLHVRDDGSFEVFVPTYTSPRRDRFTIAHELGHFFLHFLNAPDGQEQMRFTRLGSNRAETQANHFAAALIMPEGPFRDAWRELRGDLYNVAARFDVSPAAAEVRASVLRLS